MIRPRASPKLQFRTTWTAPQSAACRVYRRTAHVGGTSLVAVSSSADSNSAALSSTIVLVVWLVQLWRTCLKAPGSCESVHLLTETGFVDVGALLRRARVRPSRSLAGRGGTSAESMSDGCGGWSEVHLATNKIGPTASGNHAYRDL